MVNNLKTQPKPTLKAYLVGGAVRDELLGIPSDLIKERDWVVLGETPESLKALGFQQVGKDFPVFLHPKTHEEYALARTEKKIAQGHQGFSCFFDPSVTLEADLFRRDLTINAIAKIPGSSPDCEYLDPFNGIADINSRTLRHVSPAFSEDPLRVLRVARFLAQLSPFDFKIAPDTLELMKNMVRSGELNHLSGERILKEIQKALETPAPEKFFNCLKEINAIGVLSREPLKIPAVKPELSANAEPLPEFSPKSESQKLELKNFSLMQKFSWFFYKNIKNLKFIIPTDFKEFGLLIEKSEAENPELNLYRIEKNPSKLLAILDSLDVIRRPERFQAWGEFFALLTQDSKPQAFLTQAAEILRTLDFKKIITDGASQNPALDPKAAVYLAKEKALREWLITDELILRPAHQQSRKRYSTGELLEGVTPEGMKKLQKDISWAQRGKAIGREI